MTDRQARDLAHQVAQQSSGVSVKFGRTNGRPVLHLIGERTSQTISERWEWSQHAWNHARI